MPETTLGETLENIGSDAQASLVGLTIEQVNAFAEAEEAVLLGTVDEDFNVPIKNGTASAETSAATYGVTIKGYLVVKSPSEGTWTIMATVDDNTVVNRSGVSQDVQIPFEASTKLFGKTRVKISAAWSNKADTTLTVHLHATY